MQFEVGKKYPTSLGFAVLSKADSSKIPFRFNHFDFDGEYITALWHTADGVNDEHEQMGKRNILSDEYLTDVEIEKNREQAQAASASPKKDEGPTINNWMVGNIYPTSQGFALLIEKDQSKWPLMMVHFDADHILLGQMDHGTDGTPINEVFTDWDGADTDFKVPTIPNHHPINYCFAIGDEEVNLVKNGLPGPSYDVHNLVLGEGQSVGESMKGWYWRNFKDGSAPTPQFMDSHDSFWKGYLFIPFNPGPPPTFPIIGEKPTIDTFQDHKTGSLFHGRLINETTVLIVNTGVTIHADTVRKL